MSNCSPCLYCDKEDHTWRFYVKNSGEFMYCIMYEEGRWTKENKIASEVVDFAVNIDSECKVYIIYSNGVELKYCVWENNQWIGKTLYRLKNVFNKISEIDVNIIDKSMHVFFIIKSIYPEKTCSLMHFCLSDEGNLTNTISNICLIPEMNSYYQTEVLNDGSLYLLFINNEENEAVIKFTEYRKKKWSIPKRLYGINGSKMNFSTLQHNNKINILNLSKENYIYSLEHVSIEQDGKIKSNKIYNSSVEPTNYSLLEVNGILWTMWSQDEKVLSSSYTDQWSEPIDCVIKYNESISMYKYLSLNSKFNNIKAKYILGTISPKIKLLLPEDKSNKYTNNSVKNNEKDIISTLDFNIEENNLAIEDVLKMIKKLNDNLEKKITSLQIQLQQKLRTLEESEENILRLTNAKKKAEEKLYMIKEIQQVSLKELDVIKKQQISRNKVIIELKNKLQDLTMENEQLKIELQDLTMENGQLKIELEFENNKGFIDRLRKKKSDKKLSH